MKASPRPTAPAGGVTISPANSASLKRSRSLGATRCSKLASATTITSAVGFSSRKERTASSSWTRHRHRVAGAAAWHSPARRGQEVSLFRAVHQRTTRGRARRFGPRDVTDLHVAQMTMQFMMDEGPRSHVLGLFLQPDQFGHVLVAREYARQHFVRPRVNLFNANDGYLTG